MQNLKGGVVQLLKIIQESLTIAVSDTMQDKLYNENKKKSPMNMRHRMIWNQGIASPFSFSAPWT